MSKKKFIPKSRHHGKKICIKSNTYQRVRRKLVTSHYGSRRHRRQSRRDRLIHQPGRIIISIRPLQLPALTLEYITILHEHADPGTVLRIEQHLASASGRSTSHELQLTQRSDKVVCEGRRVRRFFYDLFPAYGWRTRWRNEKILFDCRRT